MSQPARPTGSAARGSLGARLSRRPPVLRGRSALVLAAAAVVLLAVLWRVVGGSSDEGLREYSAEWSTIDGSAYRLTVIPSDELLTDASPDDCYPAPAEGHANLGFTVRVENRSDGPAPMPEVVFAINADADGRLDESAESLSYANRQIEITPRADKAQCDEASAIRPGGRAELGKGETATFTGVVGGLVTPIPGSLKLLVRYIQADDRDPTVASTEDLVAPFPFGPADG